MSSREADMLKRFFFRNFLENRIVSSPCSSVKPWLCERAMAMPLDKMIYSVLITSFHLKMMVELLAMTVATKSRIAELTKFS